MSVSQMSLREKRKIVDKVRRAVLARAAAAGRRPDPGFKLRESAYLTLHPHLAEHQHCGLCPDSEDVPRRKVVLPNGVVIFSSWYKVPTCENDAKVALREMRWLIEMEKQEAA